jgi:rubrerythrin
MDIQQLLTSKMSRRRLLAGAGVAGAGAALTACGAPVMAKKPDLDTEILNYALNLEYLEASFYLAATGMNPNYDTSGGKVTGGQQVDWSNDLNGTLSSEFRDNVKAYAQEIATDEDHHVKFLQGALGSNAVQRPAINIAGGANGAFGIAAKAAGANAGVNDDTQTALATFSPYANALYFLLGAFIFEDVGVTAYEGGAPLVTNKTYVSAAAGIEAVEGYHAGEIRNVLYRQRNTVAVPAGAVGSSAKLNVQTITGAISALRAALDGSGNGGHDQNIVMGSKANIVVSNSNGVAFSRTPREVLNIVYGKQGAPKGLFYPDGVNGDFSALLKATS